MLALRADLGGDPTWRELLGRCGERRWGRTPTRTFLSSAWWRSWEWSAASRTRPIFQVTFGLQSIWPGGRPVGAGRGDVAAVRARRGRRQVRAGAGGRRLRDDAERRLSRTVKTCSRRRRSYGWPGTSKCCWRGWWPIRSGALGAAAAGRSRASPGAPRVESAPRGTATACLHELFARQADRTPDAPAVLFGDEAASYAELESRSNRLAQPPRGAGWAGRAGRPVPGAHPGDGRGDAGHPQGGRRLRLSRSRGPGARLAFLLEELAAPIVLSQASLRGRLPADGRSCAWTRSGSALAGSRPPAGGGGHAGAPLLRDLHLRLDGSAEGYRGAAPGRAGLLLGRGLRALRRRRGAAPALLPASWDALTLRAAGRRC